ncbi:MAG: hypothetical protein AB7L84_13400 [Acidimicrobiia bacterium]
MSQDGDLHVVLRTTTKVAKLAVLLDLVTQNLPDALDERRVHRLDAVRGTKAVLEADIPKGLAPQDVARALDEELEACRRRTGTSTAEEISDRERLDEACRARGLDLTWRPPRRRFFG